MRKIMYEWRHFFRVNTGNNTPRKLIGAWLRKLAQKIDGRFSLGIEMRTVPEIGTKRKLQCIDHGLKGMQWALENEAQHAAIEQAFQQGKPVLFCIDPRDAKVND